MILLSTTSTILYSIIVFLLIILILVSVLLYARSKLTPQGNVSLHVNERDLVVSPGSNLLTTLSNNEIFLPSACGGGGT
jgi:Na+-transporting NADH:ubiquinone oxidoreductase subunit F